jgi:hypothetical protein
MMALLMSDLNQTGSFEERNFSWCSNKNFQRLVEFALPLELTDMLYEPTKRHVQFFKVALLDWDCGV